MCNLIETFDLCFSYSGSAGSAGPVDGMVLNKINLKIEEGEFVSIVGGNGSGKSTLAKTFNGLIVPADGVVVVCGVQTSNSSLVFEIRRQVGMVFQNPDVQIVATIVEEDVAFALENLCYSKPEIESRINKSLDFVDMHGSRKSLVHSLSGGQKQRVAIAGVLAMEPRCVVFDEATSMLDPHGRKKVFEVMRSLNNNGTTIVNITHNMEEVVNSERVVVLYKGQVLKDCSPKQLFADDLVLKTAKLKRPPVVELINLLANDGLLEKQVVFGVDDCVNLISKMLKGSSNCQ